MKRESLLSYRKKDRTTDKKSKIPLIFTLITVISLCIVWLTWNPNQSTSSPTFSTDDYDAYTTLYGDSPTQIPSKSPTKQPTTQHPTHVPTTNPTQRPSPHPTTLHPSESPTAFYPRLDTNDCYVNLQTNDQSLTCSMKGFGGAIPHLLSTKKHLKTIDLRMNEMTGTIPMALGELSRLTKLDLSHNHFTGTIPSSFSKLTRLTSLLLSNNELTGSVPAEIYTLSRLQVLRLEKNQFTGSVSPAICCLFHHNDNLRRLSMDFEKMTGCFPKCATNYSFPTCPTWEEYSCPFFQTFENSQCFNELTPGSTTLDCSQQKLKGTIPTSLSEFTELTTLNLEHNRLSGTIPPIWNQLKQLTRLNLNGNQFSGEIPDFNLLTSLDLSMNNLVGKIPSVGSNLSYLNLASNDLTGTIPTSFEHLSSLKELILGNNQFSGPLPFPPSLQNIQVGDNSFSGCISNCLPACQNLPGVQKKCGIQFGNPLVTGFCSKPCPHEIQTYNLTSHLCYTSALEAHVKTLHCPYKRLLGSIPPEIALLSSLTSLDLSFNGLEGTIPPELGQLTGLKQLSLEGNALTGTIPPSLGQLTGLTSLKMSKNQLTGAIPWQLGKLELLTSLELEMNVLTGEIPITLANLRGLRRLYLQQNQLSGCIPQCLSLCAENSHQPPCWIQLGNEGITGVCKESCLCQKAENLCDLRTVVSSTTEEGPYSPTYSCGSNQTKMYYADLQPKEKIVVTHEGNSQTTLRFDETCPGKTPITPCNSPQKKQEWNNSFSTTKRVFYIIDGKNPFIFQRNHLQTCPKLLLNPVPCGSSYCVLDQDSKDITAYGVNIHSKWIEFKHNGYLDLGSSFLFQGSSLKREALVMGITFVAWVQPFQLIGKSQILLSLESTHHQIKISIQETSLSIFLSNFKLETIINPNQNLLELAQWAHIAVVMDATPLPTNPGTYTFFINGVQKTQIKTLHEGVSSFKRFPEKNEIHYEKAFIGAPYDASNLNYIPFQGQMSDIRLYSYPLTKERINEIWGGLEKPKQR